MIQRVTSHILNRQERGQSLVEVALFFPIFLIILAGVVEVSHLAITQNRVSNAARASTRYSSQGGDDEAIPIIALNSVTATLDLSEGVWDMWSIRGKLTPANQNGNGGGQCCEEWEFTHVYGIGHTKAYTDVDEDEIKQEVVSELQLGDASKAAGLEFVGTYLVHDIESILGLQAIPALIGFNSVKGLNVMRVFSTEFDETGGCDGFPIAVEEGIRSVYPPLSQLPNNNPNPFPAPNDFHSSSPKPTYTQFYRNVPDIPLEDAHEGYIYKVQNGTGSGSFGWLVWNNGINASSNTLADSLDWPGNARDYANHGDGGQQATPLYNHVVRGYVNPLDTSDLGMNIGDWVTVETGSVNSNGVRSTINDHITKNRYLRLIVWGYDPGSNPPSPHTNQGNEYFKLKGFAVFRLLGHNLSQGSGSSWILAEFIRWDTSCGQS
ncbi:MAG: pilus assembly protein [Ardenticatenaceae bacterium]|nr:pilus assembly protein [Ardenticatenaceae bacterium]